MPTRTIKFTPKSTTTDLKNGVNAIFQLSSDSGAVSGNVVITGGSIAFPRVRWDDSGHLNIYNGGTKVAQTATFSKASSGAKTLSFTSWENSFLSSDISNFQIAAESSGTGSVWNIRNNNTVTVTINYSEVTVSAPTNLTITQNATNGTYSASWTASTVTPAGAGTIQYTLEYYVSSDGWISATDNKTTTSTSFSSLAPHAAHYATIGRNFRVVASCMGATNNSSEVNVKLSSPTLNSVATIVTPDSGDSVTVSTNKALTTSYGQPAANASYTYFLYYSVGEGISCNTLYETNTLRWGVSPTIALTAEDIATKIKPTPQDEQKINFCFKFNIPIFSPFEQNLENASSTASSFTYESKYTVGYYDETQQKWVECIVYYYDTSKNKWVECIPHYNNGTTWKPIKTKV